MKLTYTAKTATIKGSFTIYTDNPAKHKINKVSFVIQSDPMYFAFHIRLTFRKYSVFLIIIDFIIAQHSIIMTKVQDFDLKNFNGFSSFGTYI